MAHCLKQCRTNRCIYIYTYSDIFLFAKKNGIFNLWQGKKNCDSNDGNGLAALHVGAVENKLNRLPALKDSKLFHPVQLTPPVYLARREWIAEWSFQVAGFWYRLPKRKKKRTVVVTYRLHLYVTRFRYTGARPALNGNESWKEKRERVHGID